MSKRSRELGQQRGKLHGTKGEIDQSMHNMARDRYTPVDMDAKIGDLPAGPDGKVRLQVRDKDGNKAADVIVDPKTGDTKMTDAQIEAVMAQGAPGPGEVFRHDATLGDRFAKIAPSDGIPDERLDVFPSFATTEGERKAMERMTEVLRPLRPDKRARAVEALVARGIPLNVGDDAPARKISVKETVYLDEMSRSIETQILAAASKPVLQRLNESCFHKCLEAWLSGEINMPGDKQMQDGLKRDTAIELLSGAQVIVVQHDLAAAFKNSNEFAAGAWSLPYGRTMFEFRISGLRCVLALIIGPGEGDIGIDPDHKPHTGMLNIETSDGWTLAAVIRFTEAGEPFISSSLHEFQAAAPLVKLACDQARAICICLEAEVALTEIVRAPTKLNAAREKKGKLPIYDYHVVDLAHRKRYLPRAPEEGDLEVEHRHRRLHWVRAHIRHYPNHTVPIKWHLRGDPDLGFVDKEYRL